MIKKSSQPLADELKPYVAPFRYDGSGEFHLKSHKTNEKGGLDKEKATRIIEANRKRLQDLQETLYAQDRWSLLLIFQGMDAAGKDSAIKSVFDGVNPQGCEVTSFKQPSANELDHDYLWRSIINLPPRGHLGIFNRSYYEECLVVRVHPHVLAKQKLPEKLVTDKIWRERFDDINAFERYLTRNGTVVLKFFLNISKEEQRQRFLDRLDEPAKNWKFSIADVTEREHWDKYQDAYQDMIANTATKHAPWFVVPSDHKWFARVVIGSAIVQALEGLNLKIPRVDAESLKEFADARTLLEREGNGKKVAVKIKSVAKDADAPAANDTTEPSEPPAKPAKPAKKKPVRRALVRMRPGPMKVMANLDDAKERPAQSNADQPAWLAAFNMKAPAS
jgi:PPK2 family polyphosphate:nucleotide phosphotransferase